ncbi:unnamed protein product [Symbiodinium natans]|uniref:Uncharacterized protein n=1 Tax=Symbiodinium natans TaxID=878477 RepID=A0A812RHD7_9DINO|nr:unnamed protein product [Symbiodinium natans]
MPEPLDGRRQLGLILDTGRMSGAVMLHIATGESLPPLYAGVSRGARHLGPSPHQAFTKPASFETSMYMLVRITSVGLHLAESGKTLHHKVEARRSDAAQMGM